MTNYISLMIFVILFSSCKKDSINQNTTKHPDLVATSIVMPATASPGSSITVTYDDRNDGEASATNFKIRVYLSTTSDLTGTLYQIYERTVTATCPPGWVDTDAPTVVIPNTVPNGNYFGIMRLDPTNVIAETNENNNYVATSSQITIN